MEHHFINGSTVFVYYDHKSRLSNFGDSEKIYSQEDC